jgi:hypothetical protein
MDGQSVIALIIILAVVGGLTVRALPFIVGLLGVVHGLFIAPVVQTVKDFKERYLLLPEDAPGYYVDEPLEEVVSSHTNTDMHTADNTATLSARLANLTDREWVRLIAARKKADKWAWTGNRIYAMVGGDRNEVLGWIQEVRNTPEPDPRFPESTKDGRPVASHLRA